MIKVELSFDRTSEPLVFNNVMNTYQKGDLFCTYYYNGEKSVSLGYANMKTKKPVYIVISGKKKHGKNYFADMVKHLLVLEGISFTETAFATPIKEFCENTFGIPMEDMETQEGKLKPTHIRWSDLTGNVWKPSDEFITVRELLQIIGTEIFREGFYSPIWAEAPFRKKHIIETYSDGWTQRVTPDVVFIPDCRFPNEVEEAKKHDAILVRVVRDDIDEDGDTHPSEIALDNYAWNEDEVVHGITGDADHSLYLYAQDVILPKIKGRLFGGH